MKFILIIWLFLVFLNYSKSCLWPDVDALFIVDSTQFVTSFQHQNQIEFLRKVLKTMRLGNSRISISQFNPGFDVKMTLDNSSYPDSRLQELKYSPCQNEPCSSTTINSLYRFTMTASNRKSIPDVIIVISNSYSPLVEVASNEPLVSPLSPLHVFYIVIGSTLHVNRFEPSAHTVGIKVIDFENLPHLVNPLCESVNGYVKGTSSTKFGPLCWIIIGSLIFLVIVLIILLSYALYYYQEENRRLRYKILEAEKNLRKQNEYFTAQLHSQMEKQIEKGEKYAEEMKKQQEIMQNQLDQQLKAAYQQGNKYHLIPINTVHPDNLTNGEERELKKNENVDKNSLKERRDSGIEDQDSNQGEAEVDIIEIHPDQQLTDKKEEEEDEEEVEEEEDEDGEASSSGSYATTETDESNRATHLARDHPARMLPPIDLMILFDTSSSIGINNFDIQKNFVCEILKDVDISPGRSRIALIQYSQDPSVVFGFDQYYSYESVRRGVMRLSYTGGATMLSKALAFAGGIMYHEQNMKKTIKKHPYMSTPKHDRLQVLCLISDGYSDDKTDKESILLHDRLHVKIFAIVTRSFNKNKLIPITRFDGAIFTIHQRESVAIWLWRQQRIWAEYFKEFIEKEKKRQTAR